MIRAGNLNKDLDVLYRPRSYTPSLNPSAGTTSHPTRGLSAVEAYSKLLLEPNMHLLKSHQHLLLLKPPTEDKEEQEEQQQEEEEKEGISPSVSFSLQYYVDVMSVIDRSVHLI